MIPPSTDPGAFRKVQVLMDLVRATRWVAPLSFLLLIPSIFQGCQKDYSSQPGLSSSYYLITFDQAGAVVTIRSDGSDIRRFRDTLVTFSMPRWSPSGTHIAFYGDSAGTGASLYLMNADGTGRKRLVRAGQAGGIPPGCFAWSPDGSRIAFPDSMGAMNVIDVETGVIRQIAPPVSVMPLWSSDGLSVVVTYEPPDSSQLPSPRLTDAVGSGLIPLISAAGEFIAESWCYQTNTIFLTGGPTSFRDSTGTRDVYSLVFATRHLEKLTIDGKSVSPQVSRDGSSVLFSRRGTGDDSLMLTTSTGGDFRFVTAAPGLSFFRIAPFASEIVFSRQSRIYAGSDDICSIQSNGSGFFIIGDAAGITFDLRIPP
jgi:dipeptidyl aminopeptidase/acylaminoacyl peptidase